MNIRIQVIVGVIVILALIVIVNMIRKKRLELRYALAWLFVGVFFLGFCFSLIIIFVLTVAVSRMSVRIKTLAQEIALYEKECKND